VQCPKCRQIVILDPSEPAEAPSSTMEILLTREIAEIKARLSQLGPLQSRVTKIERELASMKAASPETPPPASALLAQSEAPTEPPAGDPIPSPQPSIAEPVPELPVESASSQRYGMGETTAHQLISCLEKSRGSKISLVFTRCDPGAQRLAEYLRDRFSDAGWTGLDLRGESLPSSAQGLALAVGSGPISPAATAIHRAFAAANIALAFQIDPAIEGTGVTLVVGAAPPPSVEGDPPPEEYVAPV
jgi:hypothetical protein